MPPPGPNSFFLSPCLSLHSTPASTCPCVSLSHTHTPSFFPHFPLMPPPQVEDVAQRLRLVQFMLCRAREEQAGASVEGFGATGAAPGGGAGARVGLHWGATVPEARISSCSISGNTTDTPGACSVGTAATQALGGSGGATVGAADGAAVVDEAGAVGGGTEGEDGAGWPSFAALEVLELSLKLLVRLPPPLRQVRAADVACLT